MTGDPCNVSVRLNDYGDPLHLEISLDGGSAVHMPDHDAAGVIGRIASHYSPDIERLKADHGCSGHQYDQAPSECETSTQGLLDGREPSASLTVPRPVGRWWARLLHEAVAQIADEL